MHNPRHHTLRRVPPLQDGDFDHEISLVDNSENGSETQSLEDEAEVNSAASSPEPPAAGSSTADIRNGESRIAPTRDEPSSVAAGGGLAVVIQEPSPQIGTNQNQNQGPQIKLGSRRAKKKDRATTKAPPESAIDVLYENQRGCILCGMPLFSSRALGNLDPPPWTNQAHKPSPTDIQTAQVPDPSWEWSWPEWRVNHDLERAGGGEGNRNGDGDGGGDDYDSGGWEYSFMFARAFSWHRPHWWNSFVRRRAWIRMRVKKMDDREIAAAQDPHMLNPDYFSVRPSSEMTRERSASRSRSSRGHSRNHSRSCSRPGTSHHGSKTSLLGSGVTNSNQDVRAVAEGAERADVEQPAAQAANVDDTQNIDDLLAVLRASRIDREKIEAVEKYLDRGGDDLVHLQEEMHEVMSLFVFQASRRLLLTRLTEVYDEAVARAAKKKSEEENVADDDKDDDGSVGLKRRVEYLAGALRHADEEVRTLEYWSDVKGMAEEGGLKGDADNCDSGDSGQG